MALSDRASSGTERQLNCYLCPRRGDSEWCGLLPDDLRLLNQSKVVNNYQVGQVIFYQGNPCHGLYCLESGMAAIRKVDSEGNSILVRLAEPGRTLGYRTFFAGGGYSGTAVALVESRVCFVARDIAQDLLERNPLVCLNFLKRCTLELQRAELAFLYRSSATVTKRIAILFMEFKDQFGKLNDQNNWEIDLPISRQDMAAMVGTRPETVARVLREFQRAGICRVEGRMVTIPDLDCLLDEIGSSAHVMSA